MKALLVPTARCAAMTHPHFVGASDQLEYNTAGAWLTCITHKRISPPSSAACLQSS